jgi:Putative peptidoglycan binding domain
VLVIFGIVAVASNDSGCEADNQADTGEESDLSAGGDNLPTCDGVVVVETASGTAQVPGDTSLFDSDESAGCTLQEGAGDDEAIVVLQSALAQCNGQPIASDGNYGDATSRAVANVQQQHGVPVDGAYGPATLEVMGWPVSNGACVSGVSAGSAVVDEAS